MFCDILHLASCIFLDYNVSLVPRLCFAQCWPKASFKTKLRTKVLDEPFSTSPWLQEMKNLAPCDAVLVYFCTCFWSMYNVIFESIFVYLCFTFYCIAYWAYFEVGKCTIKFFSYYLSALNRYTEVLKNKQNNVHMCLPIVIYWEINILSAWILPIHIQHPCVCLSLLHFITSAKSAMSLFIALCTL